MKFKGTILSVAAVLLIVVGMSFLTNQKGNKIAYVKSQDLIYAYEGTLEAQQKFNKEKEVWLANVDTLEVNFNRAVNQFNNEYQSMNAKVRAQRSNFLDIQQQQLIDYKSAIDEKIKAEDQKMMQAVLNQVNSFIKRYGKEEGYDVILGTTLSGSVLYGNDKLDITDELLIALNKNYRGE
ncbi:MAG: OmpH family outer membrane protein [Bacteroidota bacterium]